MIYLFWLKQDLGWFVRPSERDETAGERVFGGTLLVGVGAGSGFNSLKF